MKPEVAPVLDNTEVMPGVHLIWVEAPLISALAQPGQFVMVRCGGQHLDPLLPRPFSVHSVAGAKGEGLAGATRLALLVALAGRGSSWLCSRREGDSLSLLGALGQGFVLHPSTRRLFLVGGGMGIAPLPFAAQHALSQGVEVTLLLGARSADMLYPRDLLPPGVKVLVTTDDGSGGRKGAVTELLEDIIHEADQAFVCGPPAMYRKMLESAKIGRREKFIQLSLEARMGCGVGGCYGCTVRTRQGIKQVCRDGPVFELEELLPQEVDLI